MVKERLLHKEIILEILPEAFDELTKEGYNPQYGARPLKRLIQTKILTPVASAMLSKGISKGGTIIVGFKKNEFTFDIKKGRKGSLWAESVISTTEKAGK
jgi:ATP-dependent Clp protease ATP-binding subunit ClpC